MGYLCAAARIKCEKKGTAEGVRQISCGVTSVQKRGAKEEGACHGALLYASTRLWLMLTWPTCVGAFPCVRLKARCDLKPSSSMLLFKPSRAK